MYTTHRNSQKSREVKKNKKTKTKKKGRRVEESRRNTPSVKRPKDHWRKKKQKNPNKTEGAKCVKSINRLVGEKEN